MSPSHHGSRDALGPVSRSAPHPALTVDPSGRISLSNDAARVLLGASPGLALADTAPGWLVDAHRSLPGRPAAGGTAMTARGPIGDRTFEAQAVPEAVRDGGLASTTWWLTDITEQVRLARELAAGRERLAFLAEESGRFLGSLNLDRCMEIAVRLAARHLADAALVIAPPSGHTYPVAYCGPDGDVGHEELKIDPAEVPGLAEAMRGFPPPRSFDPSGAPGWVTRGEPGDQGVIVVISLPGPGVPAGALLLRRRDGRAFSEGEETVVRLFALRAGAAMGAARLYGEQAAITETLMRDLLPPRTRHLPGIELAARYQPSLDAERVGGDFYDVYPAATPDGESLVVLGDVAGKGLEAAVLTGKIRTTLRALLPMSGDHRRVLELLNAALLHEGGTRFVTLVLVSVRREDGQVRMRVTGAGHAPPLIVRDGGAIEEAPTGGSLIGVLDEITSRTASVTLRPGDTCLLYTDGITEAFGGPLGDEMFGDERLLAGLSGCGGMPPEALVERVHMLAAQWVGGNRHDDMAIIAITAPRQAPHGGS